jgi:hypothetical protein
MENKLAILPLPELLAYVDALRARGATSISINGIHLEFTDEGVSSIPLDASGSAAPSIPIDDPEDLYDAVFLGNKPSFGKPQ